MSRSRLSLSLAIGLIAALVSVSPSTTAVAETTNDVVGAVPASFTPQINNGRVLAITQVGDTMVVGGTFTSVSPSDGGSATGHEYIVAFDAATGRIKSSFEPQLDRRVEALAPGPTPSTVYVGGAFRHVRGATADRLALLDLNTGELVSGWDPPKFNMPVQALSVEGTRLFVGGVFTKVGGQQHRGLATLDASSGAFDPFMDVQLTERHNNSGSGAQGAVGVKSMDINAAGDRLIVIGNFRKADGLDRDQIVMVDISGGTAAVRKDWKTARYQPLCFSWAFDSNVRKVDFAPNESWFVVTATGGHNRGTLCDTAARFESDVSGDDVQPTWVSDAGGDTLWGLAVTDEVAYVGGHQRWLNNSKGSDFAAPGAVPRPGVGAVDAENGVPLAWNPGRNPRGAGAYELYVGSGGLWVGSDTEWIGPRKYKRPRIALFPLADGYALPSTSTGSLPADVYLAGQSGSGPTNVLHRVNAGGPSLLTLDNGPNWIGDQDSSSSVRNAGSNAAPWDPVPDVDSTVPDSTPAAVFDSERWDPDPSPEMSWHFDAPVGIELSVRLYFANRCTCTDDPGERRFDVSIDGDSVLSDYDIVQDVGDQRGTMRDFSVTSDGSVDIDFGHVTENPLVNAIEIVRADAPAPPPEDVDSIKSVHFDGATAGSPEAVDGGGVAWGETRGAFMLGSNLYYGQTDGFLHRRSFDGASFGADEKVNPYRDPVWDGVSNGSGGLYNGTTVDFYGQLSSVTGMFYADGRIYYTLLGDSDLHYRNFTPDSGIVAPDEFATSGGLDWSDTAGMFISNDTLYFVKRSTGALWKVSFSNGAPTGSPSKVDDPADGGQDWTSRAIFLGPGSGAEPPNEPPSARASVNCEDLRCTFDGGASTDADDGINSFDWEFGDGTQAAGKQVQHDYGAGGTYTYTLTVTDESGATDEVSDTVNVAKAAEPSAVDFVASGGEVANSRTPSVSVPNSVESGDLLLLVANVNSGNVTIPDPTAGTGWTRVEDLDARSLQSVVWWKTATPADGGSSVELALGGYYKSSMQVLAYRGVDPNAPIGGVATATDLGKTDSHSTPQVNPVSGDWVVSLWGDKSSSTTQWAAPAGVTSRDDVYGTGGGWITALAADSGGPVGGAAYGGLTATTDHPSSKAVMWSIVLSAR